MSPSSWFVCMIIFSVAATPASTAEFELNILHTNNLHSQFDHIPRLVDYVKKEKSAKTPTMYVDLADFFSGSPLFVLKKEQIVASFLNLMAVDAMTIGEEEVMYGIDTSLRYYRNVTVPLLCANCEFTGPLKSLFKPSVTLDMKGRRVGIIGFARDGLRYFIPGHIKMLDPVKTVQEEVKKLQEAGVNIIIVLGHDFEELNKEIAKEVIGIDVVVGGHDVKQNATLQSTVLNTQGQNVIVVQTTGRAETIGRLELSIDVNGTVTTYNWKQRSLKSGASDKVAQDLLRKYETELQDKKREIISTTKVSLSSYDCTHIECNLGNVLADAFVDHRANLYKGPDSWTDTAIGMFMGALVGDGLNLKDSGGNISYANAMVFMTNPKQAVTVTINGAALKHVLEHSVYELEKQSGRFMQYSGVHVTFDWNKPRHSRVISLKVRCAKCRIPIYEEVDDKAQYKVIVTGLLGMGGLGYVWFQNATESIVEETSEFNILMNYLKRYPVIRTGNEERIKVIQPIEATKISNAGKLDNDNFLLICTTSFWYMIYKTYTFSFYIY